MVTVNHTGTVLNMYALSTLFYQPYLIKCTFYIEIKDYNTAPAKNVQRV